MDVASIVKGLALVVKGTGILKPDPSTINCWFDMVPYIASISYQDFQMFKD